METDNIPSMPRSGHTKEPVMTTDNASSTTASAINPAPVTEDKEQRYDPMETDNTPSMSLETQHLIEELDNDLDNILKEERHTFEKYLEAATDLTPVLRAFHNECEPCAAPFEIPATPKGCDDLDQTFRNACAVTDNTARAQAIAESLANNTKIFEEIKDAREVLAARKQTLSTPIDTAERYGGAVSYVTQEFSNIMIQYNQWMK
jgi:hypothetical protein